MQPETFEELQQAVNERENALEILAIEWGVEVIYHKVMSELVSENQLGAWDKLYAEKLLYRYNNFKDIRLRKQKIYAEEGIPTPA